LTPNPAAAILKDDHDRVKDLFDRFEAAKTRAAKRKIVRQALTELKVHAAVEEELFYPAVRKAVGNEVMAADNASDTNCDTATTNTHDEFIEIVNVSTKTLDMQGVTIADSVVARHEIGMVELAPGEAMVVWGGGTPACAGVTKFETATTGQLGLNDGGDTITVALQGTNLVTFTFPAADPNVSDNLSPDMSGTAYARHNMVTGAMGMFSPGKRSDGTAF